MDILMILVPIGAFMALASVVVGVIVLAKGNKNSDGHEIDDDGANIKRAKLSNKFMRYRVIIQGAVLALIAVAFLASK